MAVTSLAKSNELVWAAERGDKNSVANLLSLKADPDVRNGRAETALHRAAVMGHSVVIDILLQAGAEKYARDLSWQTPMDKAILLEQVDAVKTLVQAGYDVNYAHTRTGSRPLDEACRNKTHEIVQHLLSHGAKPALSPYAIFKATWNPVSLALMIQHGAKIDVRKSDSDNFDPGSQPLHYAASTLAGEQSIQILLNVGADKNVKNAKGHTPLDLARHTITYLEQTGQVTSQEQRNEHQAMVRLLS
jgi:ankyrin repeat protein